MTEDDVMRIWRRRYYADDQNLTHSRLKTGSFQVSNDEIAAFKDPPSEYRGMKIVVK